MRSTDEHKALDERNQRLADTYYGKIVPEFPVQWVAPYSWTSTASGGLRPNVENFHTETLLWAINVLVAHVNELSQQIADIRYHLAGEE